MHVPTAPQATVIGGGLAGTEAALQLAHRGVHVTLYEMRPASMTPAHHTGLLGELVCSNSLKSDDPDTAAGCLKRELELLGSAVLSVARETCVPAGAALAVDRDLFAERLTDLVEHHPLVRLVREEAVAIPQEHPVILATGPLTSPALEPALAALVGERRLSFYDAAAPIVDAGSLDRSVVFAASRYDKGGGTDYLNAPLDRERYYRFIDALTSAERVIAKEFETRELFCACQPIEEIARSGPDALRFGAMKPVGLIDPRTNERPFAVVQLRPENRQATAYNLVGFQTNLTFPAQRRVFRMIPGLERAEFLRYGVMHRNTFVDAPRVLEPTLKVRTAENVWIAGQLSGTEGYLEAAATGLLAALNVHAALTGAPPVVLPAESVLGALIAYATDPETVDYQPMHVNYGLVPPLAERIRGKRARHAALSRRAQAALRAWRAQRADLFRGALDGS